MALEIQASKLTAQLEAACTIEATASEEDAGELRTIPTSTRGRTVALTMKNLNRNNYYDCLYHTAKVYL